MLLNQGLPLESIIITVSYTHLDVYKRQLMVSFLVEWKYPAAPPSDWVLVTPTAALDCRCKLSLLWLSTIRR